MKASIATENEVSLLLRSKNVPENEITILANNGFVTFDMFYELNSEFLDKLKIPMGP